MLNGSPEIDEHKKTIHKNGQKRLQIALPG